MFVLDYFYFYPMLLAVVRQGEEIEAESRSPKSPVVFDLTCRISNCMPRRRASLVLLMFYGIPFDSGLIFLAYLFYLSAARAA